MLHFLLTFICFCIKCSCKFLNKNMESLSVLQIEDDGFFQEVIAGIFEDRVGNIKLTQISSLSEVSPALQNGNFDIAIIDGKFLDTPN